MAHGYLEHYTDQRKYKIYSAGIEAHGVNPMAIAVMKEDGIDISEHTSNRIDEYKDLHFDFIITVCDHAKESCPVLPSKEALTIHRNFKDPAKAIGPKEQVWEVFRQVRDEIKEFVRELIIQLELDK